MGLSEPNPAAGWDLGRVLRIAIPPLLVLVVAMVLREGDRLSSPGKPAAPLPAEQPSRPTELVPASAGRIVILAESPEALAGGLRARLGPRVTVATAAGRQAEALSKEWGIASLPAAVFEWPGRERIVCMGEDAALEAILRRCRDLGLPESEREPR